MIDDFLDYDDVLIRPCPGILDSRRDANLKRTITTKHSKQRINCVPIIVSNMDTTGTVHMANALYKHHMQVALHKYYEDPQFINNHVFFSYDNYYLTFGMDRSPDEILAYVNQITNNRHQYIMLDVANGYIPSFPSFIREVRNRLPNAVIAAGNIATGEMVKAYYNAGADIVKVGIGSGGHCRTRETAGVGVPQLSAIMDCAAAADIYGMHIIADGGINEYGDFAKAFSAGADFVMAGSFFAGYGESGYYPVTDPDTGEKYITVYGMSSKTAMQQYDNHKEYRASEGRTTRIPFKGSIQPHIYELLGSLRSAITYSGVDSIDGMILHGAENLIPVKNTINRKYEKHTISH